jgi:FixJ family two-component response regulator
MPISVQRRANQERPPLARNEINMSYDKPTVFVVDDDVSVRNSLALFIESADWHPETFATAREFLARQRELAASCLLLDVNLPDLGGLDLQRLLADRTNMPIIFISGYGDVRTTARAMKAGALEFLTKPLEDALLAVAIEDAINLSRTELKQAALMRTLRDNYSALSPREKEVMTLVVAGRLNKQVGGELGISEITVKSHRGKMMRKMRAETLADLVRMAMSLELSPL